MKGKVEFFLIATRLIPDSPGIIRSVYTVLIMSVKLIYFLDLIHFSLKKDTRTGQDRGAGIDASG
jgi:hypothetical protein